MRPATAAPMVMAGLKWPPELRAYAKDATSTARPKARPIPRLPTGCCPPTASAVPTPRNTSTKVPVISAQYLRIDLPVSVMAFPPRGSPRRAEPKRVGLRALAIPFADSARAPYARAVCQQQPRCFQRCSDRVVRRRPRLLQPRLAPGAEGRELVDRLHVVRGDGIDLDGVVADAGRHRREHAVGGTEAAEQIAAAAGEAPARVGPDGGDARHIRLRLRRELDRPRLALEVHGGRHTQIAEARVHLRGDGAGVRPGARPRRPQPKLGKFLSEIIEDRERLPHRAVAVDQDRQLARGRILTDFLLRPLLVDRHHDLLELDLVVGEREPRSHRP